MKKNILLYIVILVVVGLTSYMIGDADTYWDTWHFEEVSGNETITLFLYKTDIISFTDNGTRYEVEIRPMILYHVNKAK